jgi:glycosyltransferase involved in cell wall biosynthesis
MSKIRTILDHTLLTSVYSFTWLVAALGHMIPRRPWVSTGRIMVTGTIFNPNWYLSHVTPLTRSGVKEVILVIDEPQQPLEGVRFACPPRWVSRLLSRAGAKAIWMLFAGIRYRPDLFMGYNLVAGSCTALIAGTILRRPSCYQMTGGQLVLSTTDLEVFDYEKASKFRQRVSRAIERLAISVIKQFDLIVVRGSKSKAFLARYGINHNVAIITGSVKSNIQITKKERYIDLIFTGRLHPIKQVDQFIKIVYDVSHAIPSMKAAIVGDGPLLAELKAYADSLGLADIIEFLGKRKDVERLLACSKAFVLTSKSEGLSIAMVEAMRFGAVPVIANVGELCDLVTDGVNGYLIVPNHIDEYTQKIKLLLQNRDLWRKLSLSAVETAKKNCDIDVVSETWRRTLQQII